MVFRIRAYSTKCIDQLSTFEYKREYLLPPDEVSDTRWGREAEQGTEEEAMSTRLGGAGAQRRARARDR